MLPFLATDFVDIGGKWSDCKMVYSHVSLTPAVNFPPVTMTMVANCLRRQWHWLWTANDATGRICSRAAWKSKRKQRQGGSGEMDEEGKRKEERGRGRERYNREGDKFTKLVNRLGKRWKIKTGKGVKEEGREERDREQGRENEGKEIQWRTRRRWGKENERQKTLLYFDSRGLETFTAFFLNSTPVVKPEHCSH